MAIANPNTSNVGPGITNPNEFSIGEGIQNTAAGGGLNPNLISAWPMNEGSGVTFHDTSTGGTNTATVNNASDITWQSNAGFPGITPEWSGGVGFALASSNSLTNFNGSTPFSVSLWASIGGSAQRAFLSTLETASNFTGWEVGVKFPAGSAVLNFFLVNNYPTNAIDVQTTTTFTIGAIHYFVVTYDGSKTAAGVKLYIDGVLSANTVNFNTLTGSSATGTPLRFAARDNGTLPLQNTDVTAFTEVYSAVLTQGQISQYFANGPGIY